MSILMMVSLFGMAICAIGMVSTLCGSMILGWLRRRDFALLEAEEKRRPLRKDGYLRPIGR